MSLKAIPAVIIAVLSVVVSTSPASAEYITGVTIDSVSSQYPTLPAERLVDSSGLGTTTWTHSSSDWTSSWETNAYAPFPHQIVFDLGSIYDVAGFRVWNFNLVNEYDWTTRGVKDLTVSTSSDKGIWTDQGGYVFPRAPGRDDYTGEAFSTNWSDTRYVRFEIASNYSDWAHTGMSEIRFSAVPEPSALALVCAVCIGIVACVWRRNRTA